VGSRLDTKHSALPQAVTEVPPDGVRPATYTVSPNKLGGHGARSRRGVSARDLLQQYRAGSLEDPCEVIDLLALADLLREDDPLFAAA